MTVERVAARVPEERIRALIVDDEPLARTGLRRMLAVHPEVEVVALCANGEQAIEALERLPAVDLIFLDVEMRGIGGFGMIEAVGADRMPTIIFTTAYKDHALRAFDSAAVDYLLKPFSADRLTESLKRVRESLAGRRATMANTDGPARVERLHIRSGKRDYFIAVADVDFIDARHYHSRAWTGALRHLLREPLHSLAQQLDPSQFTRVHRSAIVNLARVREVRSVGPTRWVAVLLDGRTIPVSRDRRAVLYEALRRAR